MKRLIGDLEHRKGISMMTIGDVLAVPPVEFKTRCVVENITNIVIGSKKTRLGCEPSASDRDALRTIVKGHVDNSRPIEFFSMWGGQKCYGITPMVQCDLAELFALRRLRCIASQIGLIYSPGARFTIMFEDVSERTFAVPWVVDEVDWNIGIYRQTFHRLVEMMGMIGVINPVYESDLIPDVSAFLNDVNTYAERFYRYWDASRRVNYEGCEALYEFEELTKLGWKGSIPREMWEYYFDRAYTEHPTRGEEDAAQSICVYLANALTRYKRGLRATEHTPIKFGFAPYPPGTPSAMMRGRVDYKLKDSKNSNTCRVPWASVPLVHDNDIKFLSINEWRKQSGDFAHTTVDVNGVGVPILTI